MGNDGKCWENLGTCRENDGQNMEKNTWKHERNRYTWRFEWNIYEEMTFWMTARPNPSRRHWNDGIVQQNYPKMAKRKENGKFKT